MAITFDPGKREWTLRNRGLDFSAAEAVFADVVFEQHDELRDYGETRFVTFGLLNGRMVVICWTPRGADRHVFSMRKANGREQARYAAHLG